MASKKKPPNQADQERLRVGQANERKEVLLFYGDTFWQLSGVKYNGKHPIEAIFEANGLSHQVVERDGKKELVEPIYYAGKSYVLPAEDEVDELTKRYRARLNLH